MTTPISPPGEHSDVRPIVRVASQGNRSLWLFGAILLLGAAVLFEALNARREALTAPATQITPSGGALVTAPPPLPLPPQFGAGADPARVSPVPLGILAPAPLPASATPRYITRIVERPQAPVPPPSFQPSYVPQAAVIDNGVRQPDDLSVAAASSSHLPGAPAPTNERVLAARLRSPALTVPQGTVIAAVLETALDSTRPGGVRAIVQRDIMGFDGSRVLIPRGSRLYGEYNADISAGQKRALIRWTRLTRPDAVIVNLDSPAADPLGRSGIEGKVNSHFFERFGGAILQSILNIGAGVATSAALNHGVFVALPSATQALPNVQPQEVRRTIKVKQGTSVSVFVARDLDFSSVDQ